MSFNNEFIIGRYGLTDKYSGFLTLREELTIIKQYKPTFKQFKEMRIWLNEGNDFFRNPYLLYDEKGYLMNFIDALKTYEHLEEQYNEQLYQDKK